ncbi:hypothetical protein M1L60_22510 [Actinoplanes sp. TRM 88003]|uniref:Uncharacterized protein n=1 Tax=Paractinoplanes aksuensis TaxID=2939490 RepID=A0ABT1DRD1_9ACTN|nr:hypothetical protein [Actinoplanes aksuensis]MCO8273369.1 hypothetical protein [Actinoplanes aksuensis]
MGSSYQTVLAVGELEDVRAAVAGCGQRAVIMPMGERRWAVVPEGDGVYAETDGLATRLKLAATFSLFDSDVLVAMLFRDGAAYHEYLSDQSQLMEAWDDDDNEIWFDMLGRPYPPGATPPSGAYGADPVAFVPLGLGPVDEAELASALAGPERDAGEQHHAIVHALNFEDARPLTMKYADAVASGRGV